MSRKQYIERFSLSENYPDFYSSIPLSDSENIFAEYKFGRVTGVGATEVVVSGIKNLVLPDSADTLTITSDDATDVPAGAGARTIHIYGLDNDFNPQEEIVDMNGTTTKLYRRVNRIHVETTGTPTIVGPGNNIGTITATHNGTNLPIISIEPSRGQSLSAVYTVPAGYTAYMLLAGSTSSEGKAVETYLKSRDNNIVDAPFRTRGVRDSYQNQVGGKFDIPNKYYEKTDIAFTAISSASGTSVSSAFLMIIAKNPIKN